MKAVQIFQTDNNMYGIQPVPPNPGTVLTFLTIDELFENIRIALPPLPVVSDLAHPENVVPLKPIEDAPEPDMPKAE